MGSALLEAAIEAAIAIDWAGGIRDVYAHVWEANEDAVEWYARRAFVVEPEVVVGYYRKLRPRGARVVRRRVGVENHVRATRKTETEVDGINGSIGKGKAAELGGGIEDR